MMTATSLVADGGKHEVAPSVAAMGLCVRSNVSIADMSFPLDPIAEGDVDRSDVQTATGQVLLGNLLPRGGEGGGCRARLGYFRVDGARGEGGTLLGGLLAQ